jgi:hypothetical protein
VAGIGTASFLADVGHEIPTALLPNLLTATLGAHGAPRGIRTVLSRDDFRRTFHGALAKLADPAAELPPSCKRVRKALKAGGPQTVEQLAAWLAPRGRMLKPRTVQAALHRLQAESLVLSDDQPAPR